MTTITHDITNNADAVITDKIFEDMKIFSEIVKNPYYKNTEQGINIEGSFINTGFMEFGGIFFEIPNGKGIFTTSEGANTDQSYDLMEQVSTHAEDMGGNVYQLTTNVNLAGIKKESFVCVYDFGTAKGLPQSMYDAYEYIAEHASLPKESVLALFGYITSALPSHQFDIFFEFRNGNTMGNYFDAEKALDYDLARNS